MYNLVTGRLLFPGKDAKQMLANNKKCDLKVILSKVGVLSEEGLDLLKKILAKSPIQRLTAKEALEHPWFIADRSALLAGLYLNNYLCD